MFTLIALAAAAEQARIPYMEWDWDQPQRFYVETEVTLPQFMWFVAEKNKTARMIGFQLRSVLSCIGGPEKRSGRKRRVRCLVNDVSLSGASLPGDQDIVQPILDEYDGLLTGSVLDLVVRTDGRVTDVNLTGIPAWNLRTRSRRETLRLISRFLVAGMEVPLSKRDGDPLWISSQALLCTMPSTFGTAGPAEGVHRASILGEQIEIITNGRGMMISGDGANTYTCDFAAHTLFDPALGVDERTWTMRAEPTPGSPIVMGAAGYPFLQRGSLRRLGATETVDVGETTALVPNRDVPSALQNWPMNPDPTRPKGR